MCSQKGKSQNEEETMRTKLEGMESELSTLEKDVQRYQERQEKQNRVRYLGLIVRVVLVEGVLVY